MPNPSQLRIAFVSVLVLFYGMPVYGASDAKDTSPIIVKSTGCNSTAFVQVPSTADLFLGRQMLTADGQLAGFSGPNDCSGGHKDNLKS